METGREENRPIIVVKKRVGHAGHHGGAWKVAFADFMTAMMAFFLVMWITAQSEEIKEGVGGYFRDPVGFHERIGLGILEGGGGVVSQGAGAETTEAERHRNEEIARQTLKTAGRDIVDALLALPGLTDMGEQIDVELTRDGLRVRLMESEDSTFFDLGSPALGPRGMEVLSTIGRVLSRIDNEIILEGHTDSRQYPSREYTNWELSSDRANTARRVLETSGVSSSRIAMVRAYGDKRLRFPKRPADPANRRVTIVVLNRFAKGNANDLSERFSISASDTL